MSLAWSLYRAVAPCLGALAPAARHLASPSERVLWSERLGQVERPGGTHAWIHAASLGESLGVAPFLRELGFLQPGARTWLTATTRAGRARLAALGVPVSLAPMDAPQSTRRFFAGIQPERVFLMETELWPHWLLRARADGIPVVVVSARLSPRSVKHYARLGESFRELVGGLSGVLCQSAADAERWLKIGAPAGRTAVVGNLKNDALPVAAPSRGAARRELELDPERPLLVLGSVRPGEVRVLARVWRSLPAETRAAWQVVAVPRHPRASDDLAREARESGLVLLRRTESARGGSAAAARGHAEDGGHAGATAGGSADTWYWDDRLGVLASYYAVADAAFVGGSLLPYGGHNPLEPAACGAAVLMGSHFESQRPAVGPLAAHDAIAIARDERSLADTLGAWIADRERVRRLGAAALAVVEGERGAAKRALARLAAWRLWPAA